MSITTHGKDSVSEKIVTLSEPESEEQFHHAVTFPEGGLRAWTVVLGVWILQFCTFGYTNAYGVYNDFYVREYLKEKYSSSQISWIGSVQLLVVLSAGLFTGRAFDTGYFYHLVIGGSVLFVFCLFMLSLSRPEHYYQVFFTQGLGLGAAIGITYIPGLGVIAHYFQRRRALALGIAASGSAVGGALHPIMLNSWFHGSVGFHQGVRASATLNLGLLVIALLLMRTRLPPSSSKSGSTIINIRAFSRDPPYVITVVGTILMLAGLYFPIFFLQLNAVMNGIDSSLAFYTIAILNGASVVGRVVPNLFVQRFGIFNVVIPCAAACAILVFSTLAVKTVVGTLTFTVLYGFFSGAYVGIFAPMVASLAKDDGEIGARLGICFTFTGLGGLVGTPIAGALLSKSFIWWRPSLFAGMCVTCGTLSFCLTKFLISRRNQVQR